MKAIHQLITLVCLTGASLLHAKHEYSFELEEAAKNTVLFATAPGNCNSMEPNGTNKKTYQSDSSTESFCFKVEHASGDWHTVTVSRAPNSYHIIRRVSCDAKRKNAVLNQNGPQRRTTTSLYYLKENVPFDAGTIDVWNESVDSCEMWK